MIAVDEPIVRFCQTVHGKDIQTFPTEIDQHAIHTLLTAGLLRDEPSQQSKSISSPQPVNPESRVSVILVSYHSMEWLPDCLASLLRQTHPPQEIVLVDNGSHDGSTQWLRQQIPDAPTLELSQPLSLAAAINRAVEISTGSHLLILNPDVIVAPTAIVEMLHTVESVPNCAAAAAKLRLLWAPAFLNGMGNRIGPLRWGYDLGLGALDTGQLDALTDLPSACFAATLITRSAWDACGGLDEGFPHYYEDSEWCYRVRLLGWRILAAPKAVVYHAYGSKNPDGTLVPLSARKLKNVTYGRLRLIHKLAPFHIRTGYSLSYAAFDILYCLRAILRRDNTAPGAILRGWLQFFKDMGKIKQMRIRLASVGKTNPFGPPPPGSTVRIWNGLPDLTWGDCLPNARQMKPHQS